MAAAILTLRRGTTTPSLSQSELFFNTTTNTLNVGGTSGVFTLVKIGSNTGNITLTGNLNINGGISGSTLNITGNAKIDGNLQIGGNIVLGTGSNDIITVNAPFTGSLIPQEDAQDDLGSITKRFKELHVVSASIDSISLPGSGILSSSNENFTTFSQSVDSRLDNLQLFTSSQEDLNQTFATTGSNVFSGSQTITGSITVTETLKSQVYINPKTLNGFTVPDGHNAMLVGPVDINGSVTLEGDSSLLILDKITLPDGLLSSSTTDFDTFSSSLDDKFATLGSNTFIGDQTITGSIFMSGSTHQVGNMFLSGSLTVSGSSTFTNIGLTVLSGSTLVSGSTFQTGSIDVNGDVIADNLQIRGTNRLITADSDQLIVSSSTTYFSGDVNVLGSVTASVFSGSFIGTLPSQDGRLDNLELKSASVDISVSQLNSYTSSLKNAISVNGSNLTVIGDLVVQGTTTQVDSTQVNIGENILELNYGGALTKGGIYVKDATGTLTSGSFLWDSTQDRWIAGPSGSESPLLLAGGDGIISSSDQFTSSYDWRYLNTNGDDVVSGSSQINITQTNGYTTFSSSLADRITSLEIDSASQDSRLDALESDSGSQNTRLNQLSSFTASQETLNGFYNSFTASADNRLNNLQSFTSSIDATIKDKLNVEGVVSSSSDTSTIDFTITNGVISGDVIGGVVSGSSQVTQSLDSRYEVSGSVADLVGVYQVSGSLGSAAWYNVTTSLDVDLSTSSLNDNVVLSAGATKRFIVHVLDNVINPADITSVTAGDGLNGGGNSGDVTLTLDTASGHFTDGVDSVITPFSSSVSASLAGLASASGYINYVTNSIEQLTGIEVADFDNNVAVTFIGGTLKFIFGTPAVPSSIAASLSGFLTDRFNRVNDEYTLNGTWSNGGYTLISASLYEGSTLLNQVGSGTSISFTTTTSGSHTYKLELTGSSPLDGSIFTGSATTSGTLSKSNPASPTLTPSVTVQLGASSNQIEQGATGSISFTSSSADPSNGWNLVDVTTNVGTPYFVTGSATGSTSISIIASANYESPIGDNNPDLTITRTTTQTYTKIRSLRYGASTSTSFTAGELEDISTWDTTLGGNIGTIVKGTTNPSGQSVTISWSGDKFHYIVFDSSRSNLSNITTSGFGVLGQFSVTTVGQYKVYKTNTLQAGGAGSSITYTLT